MELCFFLTLTHKFTLFELPKGTGTRSNGPISSMKRSSLLTIDGILNLALGTLLIIFPDSVVSALGVPDVAPAFYPNILGGVLFGIGIALLIERKNQHHKGIGLGLGGAIAINLCGGMVLGAWMLFGGLSLPFRGSVFLWALVVLLVAISLAELISVCQNSSNPQNRQSRRRQDSDFT